jgi:acyl carrier protein
MKKIRRAREQRNARTYGFGVMVGEFLWHHTPFWCVLVGIEARPLPMNETYEAQAISSDLRHLSSEARVQDPVAATVIQLIADKCGVPVHDVTESASFLKDLGVDSLDAVELLIAFEHEFDLDLPDEETAELSTVGETIAYIKHAIRERTFWSDSGAMRQVKLSRPPR